MKDFLILVSLGAGFVTAVYRILYDHGFRIVWISNAELDAFIDDCLS